MFEDELKNKIRILEEENQRLRNALIGIRNRSKFYAGTCSISGGKTWGECFKLIQTEADQAFSEKMQMESK